MDVEHNDLGGAGLAAGVLAHRLLIGLGTWDTQEDAAVDEGQDLTTELTWGNLILDTIAVEKCPNSITLVRCVCEHGITNEVDKIVELPEVKAAWGALQTLESDVGDISDLIHEHLAALVRLILLSQFLGEYITYIANSVILLEIGVALLDSINTSPGVRLEGISAIMTTLVDGLTELTAITQGRAVSLGVQILLYCSLETSISCEHVATVAPFLNYVVIDKMTSGRVWLY